VIEDRVANAQALATTRLPESMSPRPFRVGSQGGEGGGPAAVFEAVLDGLLQQNNGRVSPDPTSGEKADARGPRLPRQEHHDKHALLFPPDQTLSSTLFRGIDLNRTLENISGGNFVSPIIMLPRVPEEEVGASGQSRSATPAIKPEPIKPEAEIPDHTEVRVGSPFRPITPPPSDPSTAAIKPTTPTPIGTSASASASGGKKGPVSTTPEPPGHSRSNSLSSSLSSSFTRSLSLSLPRPGTPKDQAKGQSNGEGVTAEAAPTDDASQEEIRIFNLPPSEKVRHLQPP
jgi:hypothetical protein